MQHVRDTIRRTILVACPVIGRTGCSDSQTNDQAADQGSAQKGLLQPGGTAAAFALEADGTRNRNAVSDDIASNGGVSLAGIDWNGPTQLEMSGAFLNEVTGYFSIDVHEQ